MEFYILAYQK